ncbi:hypothetical protein HII17_03485 [Thalassotalea sp. M1531]|uniref:DUF4870 domain-containing protein n=1 Tax=Thalassotalea algicola TaxID=2716224 RepID=A0A7Y0L9U7_9GAMM|nr:hypothetical protein [Thalassotalea algicola]NMP30615.1 hypothetical protein [Thalassotalea algicola]
MADENKKKNNLAIIMQSLYLSNLLLVPGLSFIAMLYLFFRHKTQLPKGVAKVHLYRSIQLSLVAGIFLVVLPSIALLMSYNFQLSLMLSLVYFVTIHAFFVLIGMLNLTKAMVNKLPLF